MFHYFGNGRWQPFRMVNFRKIERAFLENCSDTMLYKTQLESLQNCHFPIFLILVMAAVSRLGLPIHINLKGLYLQTILTEFD